MTSTPDAPRLLGEGKYELLSPIGSGAMGEVWLARHVALDRMVAAKLLARSGSGARAATPDAAERFVREARTASLLRHRNTVQLLDYGVDGEDHWLVMEYLEGRNLADELAEERRMPATRAIAIASQVLAALAEAHDYGIVHRDLKPANVMLMPWVDDDGRESELAKVVDFGIATLFRDPVTGEVAGTPEYMAPEQAQGLDLDPRADVYAVGVVLHHMVVGDVPFRGNAPIDVMLAHVNEKPRSLRAANPAISERLEAVILKALEKAPADRYASARAFRTALLSLPEAQGLKPDSAPQLPPVVAAVTGSASAAAPVGLASGAVATGLASASSPTSGAPETPQRSRGWVVPVVGLSMLGAAIVALVVASSGSGAAEQTAARGGTAELPAHTPAVTVAPVVTTAPVVAAAPVKVEADTAVAPTTPDTNVVRSEPDAQVAIVADAQVAIVADAQVAQVAVAPDAQVAQVVAQIPDTNVVRSGPDAVAPNARDPHERAKRLAEAKLEAAKLEAAKLEAAKLEAAKLEAAKLEAAKLEAAKARPASIDANATSQAAARLPGESGSKASSAVSAPELRPSGAIAPELRPSGAIAPEPAKVEPVAPKLVPALAARVAVTQLAVRGSLPRSSVQRALDGVTPALAECYRRWAADAGHDQAATGTVSLGIDVDGGATRIAVGAWPLHGIAPCIAQALSRARTRDRPDTGTVEATFALVFSPLPPRGP
ncbi:MAG: protein kinase [Deltaproteobacteria bacterium]|nr:protein kinase [Deltaproteobacteria bacterium]